MKFALCLLLAIIGSANAQFSATAQAAIVKNHNDLRSAFAKGSYIDGNGLIQPSAANMRKMKWDTTVAASAQKYANTCPEDHSGYPDLGENLYWSWSYNSPTNLDNFGVTASNSWQSEFQDYGLPSITLDEDTYNLGIGHATQMVWAETNLIGCGVKNCGKDASMSNMYRVAVVCQYKGPGNYIDSDIYQPGDTCSFCSSGFRCETSSGLCA